MKELKSLGKVTNYLFDYSPEVLEAINNEHERNYFVKLTSEEFTCVCPVTHQPDFAKIKVRYIPDKKLVESKSFKLYLTSYRNTGIFHEDVVNRIADDLIKLLDPKYLEVEGNFSVRGGIAIEPFANFGRGEFEELAKNRLAHHDME
ncbi:MAG: NADPH-dependent 7-cyano-7-deazaguanine reductase QueF [Selenomonadaceae bacterium]|nr:NADPH-dependent 7-cyano-7-deazaguanine reductase QueF [Selenomonadaceae bacterium]